ncbi:MAG: hypothetical protein FRX48_01258 [Lasallia pustulata]|uniref:Uncharacterized protein n=1 Tax=Lasallia pustulata TaxID=136370 RepID=A0A5M8PXM8_9LECA|nr:MAG: hypothetical protein FRX48_01258 [Lasallia pustulata]
MFRQVDLLNHSIDVTIADDKCLKPCISPSYQGSFAQLKQRTRVLETSIRQLRSDTQIPSAMSHTNSRTWMSPEAAEKERWEAALVNLERMTLIPRSPFVPTNLDEWVTQRLSWIEHLKEQKKSRAADLRAERRGHNKAGLVNGIGPAFRGKISGWNRGAVLSQTTIWSVWYQPPEDHPSAPWPSMEEMKEEGDERNTSGYKRFPALPRVPGNETVVWKQKAMIDPYPLDRVWELPTAESIVPPCLGKSASEFLGRDLLDAIGHEDVTSPQQSDTLTKLGDGNDSDDSTTLNVSSQDGSSSSLGLGLKQTMPSDVKLGKSYQGDSNLMEFAPSDTSMTAINIRRQLRSQFKLKFTLEELSIGQEVLDKVLCNPLPSVGNLWTASWA